MMIEVDKVADITIQVALIRRLNALNDLKGRAYVMLKPQADDCIIYQVYDDTLCVMLQKITWDHTCPRIDAGGSLFYYAVDDALLEQCIRSLTDEDWKWQREFGYLEDALSCVYAGGSDDLFQIPSGAIKGDPQ